WGNMSNPSGDFGRSAYAGYEFDSETGLDDVRARFYDSKTGRWLTPDPLGFDAGDSNLTRYVRNQPTNYTDPSGLATRIDRSKNPPDVYSSPAWSSSEKLVGQLDSHGNVWRMVGQNNGM